MIYISKWKAFGVILTCLLGLVFALPNALTPDQREMLPSWFPQKTINLGLDLQGGSHLLLRADLEAANKERLMGLIDSVRNALRSEKIMYVGLKIQGSSVNFTLKNPEDSQKIKPLIRNLDRDLDVTFQEASVTLSLSEKAQELRNRQVVDQSIEIVRRRIDESGTKEPTIQRQGDDRIVVQLPGLSDPTHIKNLLGQTAKMAFKVVDETMPYVDSKTAPVPAGSEVLTEESRDPQNPGQKIQNYIVVKKQTLLGGERLLDAQPSFGQYQEPQVSFTFDSLGGKKFREITKANIGRRLAIVLDDKVISAPNINTEIGSQGVITGRFTVEETNDLALLMRAGALPAPLSVIEERTVGPNLGADSIAAGQTATVYAIIMVAVFMLIAYSFFGFVADVAVVFNLILLFGSLGMLQATLTLPGIAGIALTIGMAVDANVLIYERIKEELRNGKKIIVAIDAGYNRAIATIIDSNLTTLIGAALLFNFGSGPIKGFAVTLALGIIMSLFTAVVLTRLIISWWFNTFKPKYLPI